MRPVSDAGVNHARNSEGLDIAWYDFGGTGPDLLLGHATGFCAHVWAPVIEGLRTSFHVFGYDLRGHGASQRPEQRRDNWDWHRYADDVAAVIESAGLSQPVSVGHSCGAATALLLEQREPGTFSTLIGFEPVMFASIPPTGPDESRDLAVRTRTRRTRFPSRAVAIDNFSARGPFAGLDRRALCAYVDHGFSVGDDATLTLRCHPEDEAAVYVMATAHRGYVELGSVAAPVTVVHGSQSRSFDAGVMRSVADRVQNGTFVSMPGVGHFGALEHPEEFVEIVEIVTGHR